MIFWKIGMYAKCIRYEVGSYLLKKRIEKARKKAGLIQDELDRIRAE